MQKNLNIEKIIFKVVQMKFLAMHITNQKLSFDIFMVGNLLNIFMEHDLNILMIFGIKEKSIILTHTMYCCLLIVFSHVTDSKTRRAKHHRTAAQICHFFICFPAANI